MSDKQTLDEIVAEAAYQIGKLAEDDINYSEACSSYLKAARLKPEDIKYLKAVNRMRRILTNTGDI